MKTQELTVEACGIGSVHTVSRICSEAASAVQQGNVPIFNSPGKTHNVQKTVTEVDDFQKDVLRRRILKYYDEGQYPTAKKLTFDMREEINYKGSVRSMHRIIKSIGFKYEKSNDGRKFLMERGDIVAARIKFLRKLHQLKTSGDSRPRVYLDETWVNQNHTKKYIWQDSKKKWWYEGSAGEGEQAHSLSCGVVKYRLRT